jgi:hypothetical protein
MQAEAVVAGILEQAVLGVRVAVERLVQVKMHLVLLAQPIQAEAAGVQVEEPAALAEQAALVL